MPPVKSKLDLLQEEWAKQYDPTQREVKTPEAPKQVSTPASMQQQQQQEPDGLDSLIAPVSAEDQARRERSANAVRGVAALGSGISALGNLIYTGQGAPSQTLPAVPDESGTQQMTWRDRLMSERLQRNALQQQRDQQAIAETQAEWQRQMQRDSMEMQRQQQEFNQNQQRQAVERQADQDAYKREQDAVANAQRERQIAVQEQNAETARKKAENAGVEKPEKPEKPKKFDQTTSDGYKYNKNDFNIKDNAGKVKEMFVAVFGDNGEAMFSRHQRLGTSAQDLASLLLHTANEDQIQWFIDNDYMPGTKSPAQEAGQVALNLDDEDEDGVLHL